MMGPRATSVLNRIQLPSADDLGRWTPKERRDWIAELERDIRAVEVNALRFDALETMWTRHRLALANDGGADIAVQMKDGEWVDGFESFTAAADALIEDEAEQGGSEKRGGNLLILQQHSLHF
jgi:hypothetical protein